jgi:hypothetical protein
MSKMTSSPPPYTCWAPAEEWKPESVMLGVNVNAIPSPPPRSDVIVGEDGFWGVHEWTVYPQLHHKDFPYLAWIPRYPSTSSVSSDILTRPVDKLMLRTHPNNSNAWVVDPILFDELKVKWKSTKAALEDPFKAISDPSDPSSVQRPMKAYTRAFEALSRLEKDFGTWRDFVEVFRNLQRSFLELSGFLDWWKDVRARVSDSLQPHVPAPTRGAIFEDVQLYAGYVHWSAGAFLLIHKSTFVLDPALKVTLSPRDLCKVPPMSRQPLLHSLPHWYYPPLVHNVVTELETAARGYAERLDAFNPTRGLKRKLEKVQNKMSDEGASILRFVDSD